MKLDNDAAVDLPVIDVSNIDSQTAEKLLKATSEWGFVYLGSQGLGIAREEIDQAFDLVRLTSSLPDTIANHTQVSTILHAART